MELSEFTSIKCTSIQHAALIGDVDYLRSEVENGGNLDCLGEVGFTALQLACRKPNEEMIDTILDFQPDMNKLNSLQNTALNIFLTHFPPNVRLLKRFLEQGADPNIPDYNGYTALHNVTLGIIHVHAEEYIRLLLQYKADMQLQDIDGYTPLQTAVFNGFPSAVSILLQNGADIYTKNYEGQTELDMAILYQFEHPNIMQLFLEHIIIQHVGKKHAIPESVKEFIDNEEVIKFKDKCNSELIKLKNITVGDSTLTYYDIYISPPETLAIKLRNPNIVQSLSELDRELFPTFVEYVFSNFRAGLRRLKAIEIGKKFFRRIYPNTPELCLDCIFSFLTTEDLEKLERVLWK